MREVARTDLRGARSWKELHGRLADYGLRLEKRGRGLAVTDGRQRVKASYVDRASSLARLEARLGRWQPRGRNFPAGKSSRWGEIQDLRRAAEGLWRRQERHRRRRSERLERWERAQGAKEQARAEGRVRAASERLDAQIREAYREPAEARRAVERHVGLHGSRATAKELARQPEEFGRLRGRGGPVPSSERRAAAASARATGSAVRDLAKAKEALSRLTDLSPKAALPAKIRPAPSGSRDEPSKGQLTRTAKRLIKNVGWNLAARVMPAVHYQILKLSLSIPRKVMESSLGRERGLSR